MHYTQKRWRLGRRRHQQPIRVTISCDQRRISRLDHLVRKIATKHRVKPTQRRQWPSWSEGKSVRIYYYFISTAKGYWIKSYPRTVCTSTQPSSGITVRKLMQRSYFRCTHICCHRRHPVSPPIPPHPTTLWHTPTCHLNFCLAEISQSNRLKNTYYYCTANALQI